MTNLKISTKQEDSNELRALVFLDEQHFSTEFDPSDDEYQYITLFKDEVSVGTVRYKITDNKGYLGRLAVRKEYRNQGLGKELVLMVENELKKKNINKIVLSAQESKIEFYTRLGYTAFGEKELDEYMWHQWMSKELNNE